MFQLDVMSRTPVYEQIVGEIERFILTGVLKPEEQLPSVRGLSLELSINPNTILKAYNELDSLKLIFSVPGKGYFVSKDAHEVLKRDREGWLLPLKEKMMQIALAGVPKQAVQDCVEQAYAMAEKMKEGDSI